MDEFDNRIRFDPPPINFTDDVGTTGQTHDTYPAPNQQPRYDWMRMFLIGLLSLQSSDDAPTQYRTGTMWFRRGDKAILQWNGSAWVDISDHIVMRVGTSSVSLQSFYETTVAKLNSVMPRYTFGGKFTKNDPTYIPLPDVIGSAMVGYLTILRPLLYVNGQLIDPRLIQFSSGIPITVELPTTLGIKTDDIFTVIIERFDLFVDTEMLA
jgi:hypothetical protein